MPILSNPKHELFAQELAKGSPASQAYVSAGYSKNDGNASRLNGNEKVRARVDELLTASAEKAGVTISRIVNELAKIGFSDIRKAIKWGDGVAVFDDDGNVQISNGVALVGSDAIDDDAAGAVAEVSQTKDGLKLKMHDKRAALVDLGRHLGMFGSDATSANVTIKVIGGLPE